MAAIDIRVPIQEAIISELEDLTYANVSENVFDSVIKYPRDILEPSQASVQFGSLREIERDLTYTRRAYGFTIVTGVNFTNTLSQAEIDGLTDRLGKAEDRLLYFVDFVPNLIRNSVQNTVITDIVLSASNFDVVDSNLGPILRLAVSFDVIADVMTKIIE